MGKAIRWLKGLFGIRKERKNEGRDNKGSSRRDVCASGLCHNPGTIPPNITPAKAAWLNCFYVESDDKEQRKHAIAVATARAAAADAAFAAVEAAYVRLTSRTARVKWAAIKIQSVFRGFLARKSLKALKGLVKVQAAVRGYLIRKEVTAILHGMQALMRAQATLRALKYQSPISLERFQESTTMQIHSKRLSPNASEETAKIVELDTARPKSRSRRTNTCLSDPYDNKSFQPVPPETSLAGSDSAAGGYECCRLLRAQSTPRFANSCGSNTPVTQAQIVCGGNHHNLYPNFMAITQSFKAKLRSYIAPKKRLEAGPRKKMMESTTSLSGVKMQRSCSQAQGVVNSKNTIMGKDGNSEKFTR